MTHGQRRGRGGRPLVTDPKSQGFGLGPRFKRWCHCDELGNFSKGDFFEVKYESKSLSSQLLLRQDC